VVDLLLHITRGEDNRLSGTVWTVGGAEAHHFSGTLELMRVFEDLVPIARETNREGREWTDETS
jgi:hypothetical protein